MSVSLHRPCAVVLAAIALQAGCEASAFRPDPMPGCYSTTKGGLPEIKVSKANAEYAISLRNGRAWSDSTALRRTTGEEVKQVFASDTAAVAEGLVAKSGGFAMFRVKHDAKFSGRDSTTDYVALLMFGAMPAFQVKCE